MEPAPTWLGHRDRLRRRVEAEGLDALKPHEVLELILFQATPRADVTQLARDTVDAFGSLERVLSAGRDALMAVPGMTAGQARWIMLTGELVFAYGRVDKDELPRMWRFKDVLMFLGEHRREVDAPSTWIIYTDYENHMLGWFEIANSLCWTDPMVVQEVVRQALGLGARHAILVLFFGVEPLEVTPQETEFMVSFSRTLRALDVELLDCVLSGEAGIVSMNLTGQFDRVRLETKVEGLHERYAEEDDEESPNRRNQPCQSKESPAS